MAGASTLLLVPADVSTARLDDVCGASPGTACRLVLDWTDNAFLAHLADKVVGPVIKIVIIWVVAVLVTRVIRLVIKRVARRIERNAASGKAGKLRLHTPKLLMDTGQMGIRRADRAKTTSVVLRSLASFVVYSLAVLYSLSALGVNLGPLLAGAGIVGVALGFGAQTMVRDFVSGAFILVEDQFGVGDVIDIADTVGGADGRIGTVEHVSLRTTSVRDVNGTIWHVPNGEIRRVGNMSQGWARSLLDIPVPYGTELESAIEVIRDVAHRVTDLPAHRPDVLGEPEVWGVQELGADAVLIRLVIKTRPGEQWAITRTLQAELYDAFAEAGIEFPFTQRTIWVHHEADGEMDAIGQPVGDPPA